MREQLSCPCGRQILDLADLPDPPLNKPGYKRPTVNGVGYGNVVYWRSEQLCTPCSKAAKLRHERDGWPPDPDGNAYWVRSGFIEPWESAQVVTDAHLAEAEQARYRKRWGEAPPEAVRVS